MENPFKKIYSKFENNVLKNASPLKLRVFAESKASKNYSTQLEYESVTVHSKNLGEWKTAIQLATDPESPDRSSLRTLYENLLLDNHLASVIDSRILFCQRSTFKIVNESGEEKEELSKLLERTWFEELVRLVLMARFQGTTLLELFDVDELGELIEVSEIPLGYFNPKKGIITKTPGEDKGWLYKEGAMANYYLQVGKDRDLGMLAQVAPIVLAKKLGVGAWLDFVEKYGVPPLFITTDREDDQRLNQLFEAAQNFKSNHFMVGRGSEKFEIANITSNNPSGAFDPLIERANSEISKRFLGGTGLTDEKGFVGSVEIQFKLAKDRFESDKLMIKNIMNKQVFPRLVKLSSVYSALSNHYFEWDNAEIRTSKETAELVDILGTQFEVDPEWVAQQTGVPILGQKTANTPVDPTQQELKKKSQVAAILKQIEASYHLEDCDCATCTDQEIKIEALDFSSYDSLIDTIAKQLHEGKIKPEDLNIEMIKQTYNDLSSGAKEGFGKSWETQYSKKEEDTVVTELKKNLYTFAGAKSYAMLETVNKMVYSQDGKMRPFNEYSQMVRKVNAQYNKHWLQAEYQTARAAAQMANKWQKIQAEKELFPNLRYRTTGDGKVRDEHVMLNGIVKPVDDPFWGIYYPPNGWRCRCDVVQTAEKVTQDKIADLDAPDMPGNVGADEEIFTNNHKFFKLLKTNDRAVRNSELMKLNAPLETAYINKGKSVKVNIFHDKKDFADNFESAKIIVDELKLNVEIRGHINLDKFKNPEYFINGKLADRKTQKGKNVYSNLSSAKLQKCKIIVFDVHKDYPFDLKRLINNIKGNILANYNKETFETIILIKESKAFKYEVSDWYK